MTETEAVINYLNAKLDEAKNFRAELDTSGHEVKSFYSQIILHNELAYTQEFIDAVEACINRLKKCCKVDND